MDSQTTITAVDSELGGAEGVTRSVKKAQARKSLVKEQKVVWGVDLDEPEFNRLKAMRDTLVAWNKGVEAAVLPVSVFSAPDYYGTLNLLGMVREDFTNFAMNSIAPVLERLKFERLGNLKVLQETSTSLGRAVKTLLHFAEKERCSLIAVNTHARRGLEHFWIGSFAETLIGSSKIPILTINPHTLPPKEISTFLCPTTFSSTSQHAFKQTLLWARQRHAKIVLFHQFEMPFGPGVYGDYSMMIDQETIEVVRASAESQARQQMKNWLEDAEKAGVECKAVLEDNPEVIAKSILKRAEEEGASVIVMTTHMGPLGQKIIGSVAREVLTAAPCPVIVVHDSKKSIAN